MYISPAGSDAAPARVVTRGVPAVLGLGSGFLRSLCRHKGGLTLPIAPGAANTIQDASAICHDNIELDLCASETGCGAWLSKAS